MAAKHDLEIKQLDISNAYLQGNLDEEIYMEIPEGMNVRGEKALLLKKGLYGLKQSGRIWNRTFKAFIMSKGFTPISCDNCVFVNKNRSILSIYVDDILVFAKGVERTDTIRKLISQDFKTKDLGPVSSILGIRITRDRPRRTITLGPIRIYQKVFEEVRSGRMQISNYPY